MKLLRRLLGYSKGRLEAPESDDLGPGGSGISPLSQRVADLDRRLRELEADQVQLLAEWSKTRSQVLKHLQRVAQIAHLEADQAPDLGRQLLTLKTRGGLK